MPWATDAAATVTTVGTGHGRLAEQMLERSAALNDYLDWLGVGHVVRRTCRRVSIRTGEVQEETTDGVTSLPVDAASAADVETRWRGHGTIDNRVQYPRDVTLGEDAGPVRVGAAAQAVAALRKGLVSRWRARGWTRIADAIRHAAAAVERALHRLTLTPARR